MRPNVERAPGFDTEETAGALRRILKALERGELTAPPVVIAYLEGALVTLEHLSDQGR